MSPISISDYHAAYGDTQLDWYTFRDSCQLTKRYGLLTKSGSSDILLLPTGPAKFRVPQIDDTSANHHQDPSLPPPCLVHPTSLHKYQPGGHPYPSYPSSPPRSIHPFPSASPPVSLPANYCGSIPTHHFSVQISSHNPSLHPSCQSLTSTTIPPTSSPAQSDAKATTTSVKSHFQLPPPVTAHSTSRSKEWIGAEHNVVPPLIAWIGGLLAVSSKQPGAVLLFVCAGAVILATYFVPHSDHGETRILSAFLRRLHDTLIAIGCSLIVLGIGLAFPKEIALIPLFAFIFFAGLVALFRRAFAPWVTATLFSAALLSLIPFVVLTFIA